MMESRRKELLDVVHKILREHPEGVREYDFLLILRDLGLPIFSKMTSGDSQQMFRAHFILFHLLYCLRDLLHHEKKGSLEINCLKIILRPWQQQEECLPDRPDRLREYYQDLTQLEEIKQQDVEDLIERFWELYFRLDRRSECLALLGLTEPASPEEIKRRYRELVLIHHPDQGGRPEDFRSITEATEILLS